MDYHFTEDQLKALDMARVSPDATAAEKAALLEQVDRTGLSLIGRQIMLLPVYDPERGGLRHQVYVTIDGMRLIASRTERYAPGKAAWKDSEKGLVSASYTLHFLAAHESPHAKWMEIEAEAFYVEYVKHKKDGQPNKTWATMPKIMLAKVAEALALRRAFPAELSGLYTEDELPSVVPEKPPSVVPEKPPSVVPEKPYAPSKRYLALQALIATRDLTGLSEKQQDTITTLTPQMWDKLNDEMKGRIKARIEASPLKNDREPGDDSEPPIPEDENV